MSFHLTVLWIRARAWSIRHPSPESQYPADKGHGDSAYAGTVVEEGELVVRVVKTGKTSRYDKVVAMIEESEKLKSGLESKAEHLADGLVPWTLGGTILTYLLTRNITKTLAVLMVDYSCALKMSMPIAVLSAIQEANMTSPHSQGRQIPGGCS